MPTLTLNDLQRDALKEVGNIGAGHAATALSQLLNTTVKLSEPRIDVLKFRDLSNRIGSPERIVAALHMYVRGEAPGQMVVLFDREQAAEFVNVFIKRIIGDIQIDQDVFLIESQFLDKDKAVSGQFILIPETGSLQPLLSVFGVDN